MAEFPYASPEDNERARKLLPARMLGYVTDYSLELRQRCTIHEIQVRSLWNPDDYYRPPQDFLFRTGRPDLDWGLRDGDAGQLRKGACVVELHLERVESVTIHAEHLGVYGRLEFATVNGLYSFKFLRKEDEADTPVFVASLDEK